MPKWYEIKASVADDTDEIYIYDEIGLWGIEAKQFIDDLNRITAGKIDLRLNTPGGSVFDGNAMYNALKRHSATITTYIDGLAASMGSIIALAGDKVHMADNAMYMIHNPWTIAWGEASDLRKSADTLDKLKVSMVRIYADKTGLSDDEVIRLMDEETWFTADEARDSGFVDDVQDGLKVAACFEREKFKAFKNTPNSVIKAPDPEPEKEQPDPPKEPEPDYTSQQMKLKKAQMLMQILDREPA